MLRSAIAAALCLAAAPALADSAGPSASVLLQGRYARVTSEAGLSDLGAAGAKSRFYVGEPAGLCLGLDAEIGATDEGLLYAADAYLLGGALRLGEESVIALCGGGGLSGIDGALPFAWQIPASLEAEVQLGPVRAIAWGKATWILGEAAREEGTDLDLADELAVGAGVRFGENTRYWGDMTAGHGVYLGATFEQRAGLDFLGLVLGLGFWGGG